MPRARTVALLSPATCAGCDPRPWRPRRLPPPRTLCGRHHADVAIDRQSALAAAAARASAVEGRQVFGFEVRGPFEGHRAAAEASGGLNLGSGEAERRRQIKGGIIKRAQRNPRTSMGRRRSPNGPVDGRIGEFRSFTDTRADVKVGAGRAIPGAKAEWPRRVDSRPSLEPGQTARLRR